MGTARIFKAKVFNRFASKEGIGDATLVEAARAILEMKDEDLGKPVARGAFIEVKRA